MTEKRRRGFAAMDPDAQRALAARGGAASHAQGVGHQWTPEQAREAGRLGGQASARARRERKPKTLVELFGSE